MEKNYTTKEVRTRFSSGVLSGKKALLAKIILLICILALIAAKSFGQLS